MFGGIDEEGAGGREGTYPETSLATLRAILILRFEPMVSRGSLDWSATVAVFAHTVNGHTTSLPWSETEKEEVSGALGGMVLGSR